MVKGAKIVTVVIIIWTAALIIVGNSSAWAREDKLIFKDLKGSWAAREINYLAFKGIVNNAKDGKFYPQAAITRAEFVKLIVKAMDLEISSQEKVTYQDVNPREWYYPFIEAATTAGLIRGAGESFYPEKAITREEGAVVIVRAIGLEEEGSKLVPGIIHTLLLNYPDREGVSAWADEAVALAVRERIMIGQPGRALEPLAELTREEAAALIVRLMVKQKLIPN